MSVPTDMSILRGILAFSGAEVRRLPSRRSILLTYTFYQLLPYKKVMIDTLKLMTEYIKSERGYSGASRLVTRMLNSLTSVTPLSGRFVGADEWDSQGDSFERLGLCMSTI